MARLKILTLRVLSIEDFSEQAAFTNKFTLKHLPIKDTVMVLRNGIETKGGGSTSDYSLSGKNVTINFHISDRTSIVIKYFYFKAGEPNVI